METSVNNKFRAFTSLEQSKKLAEILPLESADMFYRDNGIDVKLMWEHNAPKVENPCWSLAALLDVLLKGANINTLESINALGYCCWNQYDKIYADNPVDACYEMVLLLHTNNLL